MCRVRLVRPAGRADARLAASNRPQFIALRKVLVRDLERLRALPQVDLPGMSLRLESVIAATEALPLAVDGRPRDDGGLKVARPQEPTIYALFGSKY